MVLIKEKVSRKKATKHHLHHHISKQYSKVYLPYLPVLAFLVLALSASLLWPRSIQKGILGRTTNLSGQVLLQDTNAQRSKENLPNLTLNSDLSRAAQDKAIDMTTRNYWSHNTPEGNPPWIFINKVSYAYQKAGENLAYGFADSASTVDAWMASPGHRANILDGIFQEVGFGYADSDNFHDSGASTVVVAMYGRPLLRVAGAAPSTSPTSSSQLSALVPSTEAGSAGLVLSSQKSSIGANAFGSKSLLGLVTIIGSSLLIGLWVGSHARQIRRIVRGGEQLVLHHPLVDVTVMGSALVIVILNQAAGFIQ